MKSPKVSIPANARGFTLFEVLIVTALLGVIIGFSVIMSYSSITRAHVIQERDLLVSLLLSGARARALANVNESDQGVRVTPASFILFEGDNFETSPAKEETSRDSSIAITQDGADEFDIVFERLSADVHTGVGTIVLSGNERTIVFDINEAGRINW